MKIRPIFLTIAIAIRNGSNDIEDVLRDLTSYLSGLVSDYEIIIVDNASDDDTVEKLRCLAAEGGLPNLQIFTLIKEVDLDVARWVALENALGDFMLVFDPLMDDINFLPNMLDAAQEGSEVVFAVNENKAQAGLLYSLLSKAFARLYKLCNGINPSIEAPQYRLLSKKIVNFISQHSRPELVYRYLPATAGFIRSNLIYKSQSCIKLSQGLGNSVDRGMQLLVSNTRAPMRLVTSLSLFGAFANLIYSLYVIAISIFKSDVASGWVSLSLQQSGMFFLISLVLLMLGEYILHMVSLSNEGPVYNIGAEYNSTRLTRREKLNIEAPSGSLEVSINGKLKNSD